MRLIKGKIEVERGVFAIIFVLVERRAKIGRVRG